MKTLSLLLLGALPALCQPVLLALPEGNGRYAVSQDAATGAWIAPRGLLTGLETRVAKPGQSIRLYVTGAEDGSVSVFVGQRPAVVEEVSLVAPGLHALRVVTPHLRSGEASIVVMSGGRQSTGQVLLPVEGEGLLTSYTYDNANRIASIQYPSGWKVAYTRDAMGRISAITAQDPAGGEPVPVLSDVTYVPFGPVRGMKFASGVSETRFFDEDYRITKIETAGEKPLLNLTYEYDAANNVLTLGDAVTPANTQKFTYDPLDRLTAATGGYGALAYTYDPAGNRLSQSRTGLPDTTYSYAARTNRLTAMAAGGSTLSVGYTAAGNISSFTEGESTWNYGYNQANRLGSVTGNGQQLMESTYDAFGRRVARSNPAGGFQQFVYDRDGHLLEEVNSQGTGIVDYIYLDDQPVALIEVATGKLLFLHTDRQGTPQVATSSTQEIAWQANYLPFGELIADSQTAALVQNLRFPGQEAERETGLYHNGFRDYLPGSGRYLQSDPTGLAGGLNTYGYAMQNPGKYTDPTGLDVQVYTMVGHFWVEIDTSSGRQQYGFTQDNTLLLPGIITAVPGKIQKENNPWGIPASPAVALSPEKGDQLVATLQKMADMQKDGTKTFPYQLAAYSCVHFSYQVLYFASGLE